MALLNQYQGRQTYVYAYFDVNVPTSTVNSTYIFRYTAKCKGSYNYDYLKVFYCDATQTPSYNSPFADGQLLHTMPLSFVDEYLTTHTIGMVASPTVTAKRIVFMWRNGINTYGTPAFINHISIVSVSGSVVFEENFQGTAYSINLVNGTSRNKWVISNTYETGNLNNALYITYVDVPINTVTAGTTSTVTDSLSLYIEHTTTGAIGIGQATGLPPGVTAAWDNNVISITGTPTVIGTYDYTIPLINGTGSASGTIIVNPGISGLSDVCPGEFIVLSITNSGGTWSSSNTTVADISLFGIPGFSSSDLTALVMGLTQGTATITYTLNNTTATKEITVGPYAGIISGPVVVCPGATVTLSNTVSGGAWSSSNTAVASIDNTTGVVTGVANGTATITYTRSTSCGSAEATKTIIVGPPYAGTITGPAEVYIGIMITLTSDASGGAWSSSNTAVATIDSAGVVTGVANGTATITYRVTNTCGSAEATKAITVKLLNVASDPSSRPTVAVNTSIEAITHTTTGATGIGTATDLPPNVFANWADNTITITGAPSAVGNFYYIIRLTGGSGTGTATGTIFVTPDAGTISGLTEVCTGSNITLSNTVIGGTWSSTNTAVAIIDTTTGVVSGVAAGTTTIQYMVIDSSTNTSATTTQNITVNPLPSAGTITGPAEVYIGAMITLTSDVSGGAWSSSNTAAATVNTTGVVTGVAAGTATITYRVTNTCGSAEATKAIIVEVTPIPTPTPTISNAFRKFKLSSPVRPTVTVPNGVQVTVEYTRTNDGSVSSLFPKKSGTYRLTVTAIGNGNYSATTTTLDFKIPPTPSRTSFFRKLGIHYPIR